MKRVLILLLIQGYLMAATLLKVNIDGVEVPLILEKESRLPLANVEFVFRDSGVLASNKAGLVSLAASLLNEGSAKSGAQKFAKELEDRAIEFSANAGNETFVFTIDSLKEQFDFGLDKLIELIKEPNYTKEAFEKVKIKRLGVLARKGDDFDYIAHNGLKELLFSNSALALPKLGDKKSIESLELNDIKSFLDNHLFLDNLIVVIGGDFSDKEAIAIVKKFASNLKRGNPNKIAKIKTSNKAETKEVQKDTEQAYVYFGAPYNMDIANKQKVIGKVASFILGSSGFGSRLMEEIRVKRGLAYSAYSRFIVNKTNSYFFGYLQTKLENQKEATSVVKEVVANYLKNGATQEELDSAKKFFLGSEPLRTETLGQRVGRAFNEYYSTLGLGFAKEELEIIKNLKLEELNSFIKEHQEIKDMSFFIVTNKQK
jgi:predicted Zn-dependent peptidase